MWSVRAAGTYYMIDSNLARLIESGVRGNVKKNLRLISDQPFQTQFQGM